MSEATKKWEIGVAGGFGLLVGGACVLVSLLGVLNTAFDLKLALGAYGSSTALPNSYEEAFGLFAVGMIIVILSAFGSFVMKKFADAKGKPLQRVGIVVGAVVLLVVAGRGVQVLALKQTYGSMLAYYATDGDLDDVKAELAKHPDKSALDAAVSRAAQYDNAPALALLLEAGADMRASTQREDWRRCALVGRRYEFVKTAIDHGVKPDACPGGEAAVFEAVQNGKDDEETSKIVTLLLGAGFSATAVPEYDKSTSPVELATQKKWDKTRQALEAAKK